MNTPAPAVPSAETPPPLLVFVTETVTKGTHTRFHPEQQQNMRSSKTSAKDFLRKLKSVHLQTTLLTKADQIRMKTTLLYLMMHPNDSILDLNL